MTTAASIAILVLVETHSGLFGKAYTFYREWLRFESYEKCEEARAKLPKEIGTGYCLDGVVKVGR